MKGSNTCIYFDKEIKEKVKKIANTKKRSVSYIINEILKTALKNE